jgi:hypothetical protein
LRKYFSSKSRSFIHASHLPAAALLALVAAIALRVVLVRTLAPDVVLVVHVLCVALGVLAGLEAVNLIHALGLGQLVDLGADQAGDGLFGEGVADGLAWRGAC